MGDEIELRVSGFGSGFLIAILMITFVIHHVLTVNPSKAGERNPVKENTASERRQLTQLLPLLKLVHM